MEKLNELIKIAEETFSHVGMLDVDTIVVHPELRDYCSTDRCQHYDKKWTCPPGCGTVEECEVLMRKYHRGLILQTTGDFPDSLDYEQMGAIAKAHKENIVGFVKIFRDMYPGGLVVADLPCENCKECTYPDAPCRFPDKIAYSMSAMGMVVSDVCRDNNINYYYGPGTLTYVSLVLTD